jgi:sporulation protein YlmC with PRC-barrel domain
MKKIYLAFIFGIFLLGVVSAYCDNSYDSNIYVCPPPESVTNLTGTVISGDLPADTYHIRIVSFGNESSSSHINSGASQRSPPSNEVVIQLNATGGIKLDWTNQTDDSNILGHHIFVSRENDNSGAWVYLRDGDGSGIDYTGETGEKFNFTKYDTYPYYADAWQNDTDGSGTPNPQAPVDVWNGSGVIKLKGDVGSITFKELIYAVNKTYNGTFPNNFKWDYFTNLWTTWGFNFDDATTGELDLTGWTIWTYSGFYNTDNSNTFKVIARTTNTQPTILYFPQQSGSGSRNYLGNFHLNNTIISGGYNGMDTTNAFGNTQLKPYADTVIKDSKIMVKYPSMDYVSNFENTKFYIGQLMVRFEGLDDIANGLEIVEGSLRYYASYHPDDVYFYKFISWENNRNIYYYNSYIDSEYSFYFIDSEFPETENNLPNVYYFDYGYSYAPIYIGNSFNLKITNKLGNPLENATLNLTDRFGREYLNYTDENGTINNLWVWRHTIDKSVGSGTGSVGTNNITNLNPFTIEISKEGYETYEGKMNITNPQDWTISLDEEKQSITPAALILDKIASVESLNSSSITYNITNKIINRGGSSAENLVLFDEDSPMGNYSLGNLSRGNFTLFSYLKNYERNSTNYETFLSKSKVVANDSYLENEIEDNSNQISLVIPNSETNSSLTLIKNAYYNSETSKIVNYTVSLEIVNSGGEDLENITILDSDLDYSENIDLKRSEKYTYSENILLNKSASNTNKLFSKTNGVVNSEVYQSNQLNIQIPGYGGPADAIVNAPTSVKKSESFDTEIKVLNMNEDIGQDFTINYWITNNEETKNYSSGEQTIYVGALNESKAIATLAAPSESGEYRFKTIVSWIGGIATSYDTFIVEDSSNKISGSLILKTEENLTEEKNETQKNNTEKKKEEITKKPEEENKKIIREKIKNYQEMLQKLENVLFEKKYFKTMMAIIVLFCFTLYGIYLKRKPSFEIDRLKNMKNLQVYGEDGTKIGKIKEIYLEKNKSKIYGWLVKLDKTVHKKIRNKNVLIKQKHVKSIKHIMIIEEKVSQHLEKLKSK